MDNCLQRHERWFELRLARQYVCARYTSCDRSETIYKLGADILMDPGPVLDHFPQLTQLEEMCIACGFPHLQLWRVRGQQ